jgi:hypothetical protein
MVNPSTSLRAQVTAQGKELRVLRRLLLEHERGRAQVAAQGSRLRAQVTAQGKELRVLRRFLTAQGKGLREHEKDSELFRLWTHRELEKIALDTTSCLKP